MTRTISRSTSGSCHGWRGVAKAAITRDAGKRINNFGPIDPKTSRQRVQSKRNKKQKITLPKLKFMEQEE